MGEFDSWFCEILFPKPNTHTYFLRRVVPFQPTSFISPAVLPCACVVSAMHTTSFITLTLSELWKIFLILVIKLLKGSRVQNWCYLTVLWFATLFRVCTRPAVLECNAHSHHSSLELEVKLMITLSLAFPPPPMHALVSAQEPFWGKERWSHH